MQNRKWLLASTKMFYNITDTQGSYKSQNFCDLKFLYWDFLLSVFQNIGTYLFAQRIYNMFTMYIKNGKKGGKEEQKSHWHNNPRKKNTNTSIYRTSKRAIKATEKVEQTIKKSQKCKNVSHWENCDHLNYATLWLNLKWFYFKHKYCLLWLSWVSLKFFQLQAVMLAFLWAQRFYHIWAWVNLIVILI